MDSRSGIGDNKWRTGADRRSAWKLSGIETDLEGRRYGRIEAEKVPATIPLEGDSTKVAFAFGPVVLAGLCEREQVLYGDREHPETILEHANEREWGNWKGIFQTKGQETSIRFCSIERCGV